MTDITYHLADETDITRVINARIAFLFEMEGTQSDDDIEALRGYLEEYLKKALNKTFYCCLAICENGVIGMGALVIREYAGNFRNPTGKQGYVMSMFTQPAFRRMGVSSNILDTLVTAGKNIGIPAFELHASKLGAPVYEKYGFKIHDEPTYRKYFSAHL